MVTIAFGFIVEQGAAELGWLTGGWNGLIGIPTPSLAGHKFAEREIAVLVLAAHAARLLALCPAARPARGARPCARCATRRSRASRSASTRRSSAPWPSPSPRPWPGFAGGVFAAMSDFISPESFPFFQSILFLLVVMIGGADRVLGPADRRARRGAAARAAVVARAVPAAVRRPAAAGRAAACARRLRRSRRAASSRRPARIGPLQPTHDVTAMLPPATGAGSARGRAPRRSASAA